MSFSFRVRLLLRAVALRKTLLSTPAYTLDYPRIRTGIPQDRGAIRRYTKTVAANYASRFTLLHK